MFEKVNPSHPDKLADRIAGAIVDYAYSQQENPRIAVEVLLGHGYCQIIAESSVHLSVNVVGHIVRRIAVEDIFTTLHTVPQDEHLASNQDGATRCGDNGIFKGCPVTEEQHTLTRIARAIYDTYPTDGKYILADGRLIICQSNANEEQLERDYPGAIVNPLGHWTGGPSVDAGATNRKLGSDMGVGVTGGGLHGKDLSKADVSVNIFAHLEAQRLGHPVELHCAIGDTEVGGIPYSVIVDTAREYINNLGGFEKFAEWGLLRP